MDNYVPVITTKGRPLAPCHAKRARSLVRAGKAQFRHKRGIRCIVLTKTNVPMVKQSSKLQLHIDPGSKHTGIVIPRDHPDGTHDAGATPEQRTIGWSLTSPSHPIRQPMNRRQVDATHRKEQSP